MQALSPESRQKGVLDSARRGERVRERGIAGHMGEGACAPRDTALCFILTHTHDPSARHTPLDGTRTEVAIE